jgi:hypothetical protein
MLPDWTLAPVVAALQTMRGMALVNAATLIAELGDLSRFANPRQLMAYLGLVPSEHSSGARKRSCGCARAIASSPAAANRPMLSRRRSPVSWQGLSGPSPGRYRRWRAERNKPVIVLQGGASEPSVTLLLGKAGGAAAVRRTLATTICRVDDPTQVSRLRQLHDASTVLRFRPAHQSMINRRHDGRASCLARQNLNQPLPPEPQIHAPATWKGGHESGV